MDIIIEPMSPVDFPPGTEDEPPHPCYPKCQAEWLICIDPDLDGGTP